LAPNDVQLKSFLKNNIKHRVSEANGFNVDDQKHVASYNGGCQISCNWSKLFKVTAVPKYHTADKHDTPSNH